MSATRAIIVSLLVARAVIVSRTPVSRAVIVPRATARAFVTTVESPAAPVLPHILAETSDFITTEAGDQLVTES